MEEMKETGSNNKEFFKHNIQSGPDHEEDFKF